MAAPDGGHVRRCGGKAGLGAPEHAHVVVIDRYGVSIYLRCLERRFNQARRPHANVFSRITKLRGMGIDYPQVHVRNAYIQTRHPYFALPAQGKFLLVQPSGDA